MVQYALSNEKYRVAAPFMNEYSKVKVNGNVPNDSSFIIIARYLLEKRLADDEVFDLFFDSICGTDNSVCFTTSTHVDVSDTVDSGKWERNEIVEKFVSGQGGMSVTVWQNAERKRTVIASKSFNPVLYRLLASATRRLIPWKFGDSLEDSEKAFILSLTREDLTTFDKLYAEYEDGLGIRKIELRSALSEFENRGYNNMVDGIRKSIEQRRNEIADYLYRIESLSETIEEDTIRLYGYEVANAKKTDDSLLSYFLANKSIEFIRSDRNKIVFRSYGTLEYFDDEAASIYVKDSHSVMYRYKPQNCNDTNWKKILEAIFIQRSVKIKLFGQYEIKYPVRVSCNHDSGADSDYFENPHLEFHSCLGSYAPLIIECLNSGNVIGAIEQCSASARSVNIKESATLDPFMSEMVNERFGDRKCFIMNEESVSMNELVKAAKENRL